MNFDSVIENTIAATGVVVVGILVLLLFMTVLPYLTVAAAVGLGALALSVAFAALALLWEAGVQVANFMTDLFANDDS